RGRWRDSPVLKRVHICRAGTGRRQNGVELGVPQGGRGRHLRRSACLSIGGSFVIHEEKQLVLEDWSANLATEAVVVKSRILRGCIRGGRKHDLIVYSIEVSILEVLVKPAVKRIRSADNTCVELTTGRMAELG